MKAQSNLSILRKRVAKAPSDPGVYRWLDSHGNVIYVGKAKNLKKRLANYVMPGKSGHGPWRQSFLQRIADFDVTMCESELEALMLETNLIKQLKPKYNVLMKDDKNYLFVRVTVEEEYPRVETVRRLTRDGSKYFGPYQNRESVDFALDVAHAALEYRVCSTSLDLLNRKGEEVRRDLKPCLENQIGRCAGLCTGGISKEEYRRRIDLLMRFLKGDKGEVRSILTEKMQAAAKQKKYETAARLRNFLQSLDEKKEKQLVMDPLGQDADALGVAVLSGRAHVVVLHQRTGRVIGESHSALSGQAESAGSVLEQVLPQMYDEGADIPSTILLPEDIDDCEAMEKLLTERRGGSVTIKTPERGDKSKLVLLASKNAALKAKQQELKWEAEERNRTDALSALQELLKLKAPPKRIEGYDISHLGGTETVGSMVVIKDGKAANDQYRSFTIRTIREGDIDDYQSMKEVLRRRLRRLTENVKMEEEVLKATGIVLRKARKSDQAALEKIREALELTTEKDAYKEFLIAAKGEDLIATVRLSRAINGILELQSVWVSKDFRGQRLGQLLIRKILKGIKKGKVYVIADEELEEYYADLGFRYVIKPPPALEGKLNTLRRDQPEVFPVTVLVWEALQNKIDPSLSARPDLLVIDGGKGQLGVAVDVLKEAKLEIAVIGLAKREEEIFVPGKPHPLPVPTDSPAKFLLMRLRDEAHRFANRHREGRGLKAMKKSALDDIPGIGDSARTALLKKFGSIEAIKTASDDELMSVLNEKQIEELRKFFQS